MNFTSFNFNKANFCISEDYQLYDGICGWPSSFVDSVSLMIYYISGSTRDVCRQLCNTVFDEQCSGFFFYKDTNMCTLSPYTGEWTDKGSDVHCNKTTVEFYRRLRSVGKHAQSKDKYLNIYVYCKNLSLTSV